MLEKQMSAGARECRHSNTSGFSGSSRNAAIRLAIRRGVEPAAVSGEGREGAARRPPGQAAAGARGSGAVLAFCPGIPESVPPLSSDYWGRKMGKPGCKR